VRTRAHAGVPGPVIFTAAQITGSPPQAGHGAVSIQISGLPAPDARDRSGVSGAGTFRSLPYPLSSGVYRPGHIAQWQLSNFHSRTGFAVMTYLSGYPGQEPEYDDFPLPVSPYSRPPGARGRAASR